MVMAIKAIKSDLPQGLGGNFYNSEDGKIIDFSLQDTKTTNSWVPYQVSGKQIRIQIKDQANNNQVISEFYLWDDNYKLICSTPHGLDVILTVSGSRDIGITVTGVGVQGYLV